MHNQEKVIYRILTSIVVVVVLFGVSYAAFSAILSGVETNKTITINAGDLELTYVDGADFISPTNIAPGWSATKTFSVENTGTHLAAYNINFTSITNNFINTDDLVYTLSATNGGATKTQTAIPTEDSTISSNITVAAGVMQTYTLTISYLNTIHNQIDDLNKDFGFTINITTGLVS